MTDTYAIAWTREAAIEALNERRLELGWSLIQLDEAAGQAAGTAGKYLGPSSVKGLGLASLLSMAGGLGLRVVLEVDPVATSELVSQATPRQATQARAGNYAAPVSERVVERALRHLATLDWREAIRTVAEARRSFAAEQAAKARKASA